MRILRSIFFLFVLLQLTLSIPTSQLALHSSKQSLSALQPSTAPPHLSRPNAKTRARINESFGKLPLSFEANQGQADSAAKFLSRGNGYQLSLEATEAVLQLRNGQSEKTSQSAIVKMQFINANPAPPMTGRAELPGKSHYYIGNDSKDWRTNVANYAQVEYEQVWPGINLVYYGNQRQLEYDLVVAPGANPNAVQFAFDGADKVKIDAQGNLVLYVAGGEIVLQKPFVYQDVNGARQEVAGRYQICNPTVGFHVGAYDASKPLVIDPVLVYSTYLGSAASTEEVNDIAVDQAGNVYLTGSSILPTPSNDVNVFVAKLNAAGNALVYSTALIGSKEERGLGVAVDTFGNAYVTGFTQSTNFPVRNAFQPQSGSTGCSGVGSALGCRDAFVAKLDPVGTIVYSTYLGGNDRAGTAVSGDEGYDIAVDASGQAYVTGSTISKNFPVKNAYQPAGAENPRFGNQIDDGFITKFSASGSELIYSTYLGGTSKDNCTGIAIDAAGNAYVTGRTDKTFTETVNNFPTTPTAFQSTAPGLIDGFVTKLNPSGNALVYSSFLGGNNADQGEGIAIDNDGNAYVIGTTNSTNFPLESPYQSVYKGDAAFVTKFNPGGTGLLYSTYLNQAGIGSDVAIAVDAAGNAYITGTTAVSDFPTINALYPNFGGVNDAFVAKINTVTKTVVYATYLGGSNVDRGRGIAVDAAGNAYVTGFTNSPNFPLKNPAQAMPDDMFVTKISDGITCPSLMLRSGGIGLEDTCPSATLRINVKADIFASDPVTVDITAMKADGTIDTSFNGAVQLSLAADSTPKIGCLRANGTCGASQSLTLEAGKLRQPLSLVTPLLQQAGTELTTSSVINLKDTVLEGKAVIKAVAGNLSVTSEVKVRSPLDIKIKGMEVQQGVKQETTDLWVGERDLMVRVFLDVNRTGPNSFDKYSQIQGITAKLIVKDKTGNEIIGSPFTLNKGGINNMVNVPNADYVLIPNAGAAADGSDSLNFLLSGTFDSQLNLEVKLDDTIPDRDPSNNSTRLGPLNFGLSRTQTFLYAKLRVLADTVKTEFPTQEGIDQEMEFIKQAWPVGPRALKFVEQPDITQIENPVVGNPFDLLNRLTGVGFWLSSASGSRYVYFVDRDYFPEIRGKDTLPLWGTAGTNGLTNSIYKWSIVDSNRCANYKSKCGVLAHELGHQMGLGDTYVLSGTNQKDGNPVEAGNFSWFHHEFVGGTLGFGFPYRYLDFMGNGGDDADSAKTWTDLFTWNYLRSKLLFTPKSLQSPPETQSVTGTFVVAQGQVNKNGTASFGNCYTLTLTDPENTVTPGDYVIETVDANATVLSSLNFAPDFRLAHSDQELDQFDFNFALPFSNTARQIRLRSGSAVLATRTVSPNAPTVRFISDFGGQTLTGTQQVTWTGADPDGDPLTYNLFYSPDGQLHIPLTETTATSYTWKTDNYLSGSAPMLTLVATDGVNATVVDSRSFTIPNRPPRITILSPGNQFQFKVGEPVTFTGSFFDPEEDLHLNPQLQWLSNLQGILGTGKQITAANLVAGTHLITASGADSQGARGSGSITVIIRPDNYSNIETAPVSADFGIIVVGLARDVTLSVRNTGNAPFTVNAIANNNPQFRVLAPVAPFTIAARSQQDLTVRFTPLTVTSQTDTLTITSNAANQSRLNIALVGKSTGVMAGAVATVSAADYKGPEMAAESIVSTFGTAMTIGTAPATSLPLPTSLAGTIVRVRDSTGRERLAPLFYVSPQQINYLIPIGTAIGPATIIVTSSDGTPSIGAAEIIKVAPGLFTASQDGMGAPAGFVIRVKPNGEQSRESLSRLDTATGKQVPAQIDLGPVSEVTILELYGTGLRGRSADSAVSASIGGVAAGIEYAGLQPGFLGLDQVNIRLPRSLIGRGEVDLKLTVDSRPANIVKLTIK